MDFKPKLTFQITKSVELFNKLLQEYEDFDRQHLNPRFAINTTMTSWHLTDWTYHEFFASDPKFQDSEKIDKNRCKQRISGLLKYQQHLIKLCPELEYMRLIANGNKHCILRDKNIKEETKIGPGDYSTDFSRHDYNVPRFTIKVNDEKSIDFEKVLLKTINFWDNFLKEQTAQ